MKERPEYGTWIRRKRVVAFWALTCIFVLSDALAIFTPWFLLFLVPTGVFAYIALIVTLTYWRFSPRGGDYQNKIHELILSYKTSPGDTVDIGCGSGNLILKAAQADKGTLHLGLDSWGTSWEYSIEQCRANARVEGVENVEFVKGSAARNGLEGERFRYVVSCLTFHEIRDQPNTLLTLAESLRTLSPGGTYIFLDLFDDKRHYPSRRDLLQTIEEAGCTIVTDSALSELMPLPFPLNGKKALRYARLLSGKKTDRNRSVRVNPGDAGLQGADDRSKLT